MKPICPICKITDDYSTETLNHSTNKNNSIHHCKICNTIWVLAKSPSTGWKIIE